MKASGPFFSGVGLSNSLEPRFGRLAFPGLIRGVTIIHAFMFVLLLLQPGAVAVFVFDKDLILKGEVWRVASFLLLPPVAPGTGILNALFMFIAMMIAFMINDSLEQSWGVFRTTLYCYGIFVCQILAHGLLAFSDAPISVAGLSEQGGINFYSAIFLAFATTFPKHEFRLFFIIPVQVWVLGALLGVILVFQSFGGFWIAIYLYLCFLPYLVWAVPRFLRWQRERGQTAARRSDYRARSLQSDGSFHTCAKCGATDVSHPEREFRVTDDDSELCEACLEKEGEEPSASKAT